MQDRKPKCKGTVYLGVNSEEKKNKKLCRKKEGRACFDKVQGRYLDETKTRRNCSIYAGN